MNPLQRDAQIGLIHFMAFPEVMKGDGPILETLRHICEDEYFEAIEVTRINEESVARQAAAMLAQAGMTVAFGTQPVLLSGGLNLNALDEAQRRAALDAVLGCFDQAAALGASSVAVLSGAWEAGREKAAEDALVASLIELVHEAADYGLDLTCEVFDDSVDKKSFMGKARVSVAVGQRVRRECSNFGFIHDLSHMPLLGETPAEALAPIEDLLVHMHLGNCVLDESLPACGDQHPRFGVAGGCNNVPEVTDCLETLYEIGFLGGRERPVMSFEVKPLQGEDSGLVIANAKRTLDRAAARLHDRKA